MERMDLVYQSADTTLVAVTIEDANSYLPGVQELRSTQEYLLRTNGCQIYCGIRTQDQLPYISMGSLKALWME
jgi:hypothetical protein